MTTLLSSRAEALCRLAGHDLDEYDPTSDDPGALLCAEPCCHSSALVGLWNCMEALREALVHVPHGDLWERVAVAECAAEAEVVRLSLLAFGDGERAGDVLAGGAG